MDTIDVRTVPHQQRHPAIFDRLDALGAGDVLELVNDHDPVPLRYQLDAARPGQFAWEPVEEGPETWRIHITGRAHVIDARPVLAEGGEPFGAIMEAAAKVGAGEVLVVYAPFEPVPLEGVLAEQGFSHVADEIGGGDWRVTFLKT